MPQSGAAAAAAQEAARGPGRYQGASHSSCGSEIMIFKFKLSMTAGCAAGRTQVL